MPAWTTEVVAIEDFVFDARPAGLTERLWLHVGELLNGPVLLPTIMVNGSAPGPTLFAVAGVHGDEYEGMAAIRRVASMLDPATMAGRFVAIPVANPFAYEARARVAPPHVDGLNLARVFPGDVSGSPSRMLAAKLLQLVLRNCGPEDVFLDFHSGSADVAFSRLIGFRDVPGEATRRAEEAARYFGLSNLWKIPDAPGPFNAETARRGIVTLGTETTGRAGCDPDDVAVFARGLSNLLAYLGIQGDAKTLDRFNGPSRSSLDVVASATGFFVSERRLDGAVSQGDLLGVIVDLFGDPIADVRSPAAGLLWALRSMPPVRAGELIACIASV